MSHFSSLPPELVLKIADTFVHLDDHANLAAANRDLYEILNPYLYRLAMRRINERHPWMKLILTSICGYALTPVTLGRFLDCGLSLDSWEAPCSDYTFASDFLITSATPLGRAIEHFNVATTSLLLGRGTDPNKICNSTGDTPLLLAIRIGSFELALLLLDHGAVANDVGPGAHGTTPPLWAITAPSNWTRDPEEMVEIAELLMERGAVHSQHADYGQTPLIGALKRGHDSLAELFLDHGVLAGRPQEELDASLVATRGDPSSWRHIPRILEAGADVGALGGTNFPGLSLVCLPVDAGMVLKLVRWEACLEKGGGDRECLDSTSKVEAEEGLKDVETAEEAVEVARD